MASRGKSVIRQTLYKGGGVKVVVDPRDVEAFLNENSAIRQLLLSTGEAVAGVASSTAQDAQGGPGGRLHGYAESGFKVEYESGSKRPQVKVRSLADPMMALRVHFYSQRKNGVGHLRAALYAISQGSHKVWPSSAKYRYKRGK